MSFAIGFVRTHLITIPLFWDVTLRYWVSSCERFEGTYYLQELFLVHLTLENESNMFLRNAGNHSHNDAASRATRPDSPIAPL